MSKYTEDDLKVELENKEYEYGFYTELDSETFPIGLNEDIVRAISKKKEGYIFVYQDVRGRYKSEGLFTNMTPVIDNTKSKTDVDEGSDTYDTIDWLVKNAANNNGRVGQWGISYPGFYTAAGILSDHPALKASSPQAPISDFFFDDFHHKGAFLQSYFFTFPVFVSTKLTLMPSFAKISLYLILCASETTFILSISERKLT